MNQEACVLLCIYVNMQLREAIKKAIKKVNSRHFSVVTKIPREAFKLD
jgi:hypothetical protein